MDWLAQRPVSPVGKGIELRRLLLLFGETALKGGEIQLDLVTHGWKVIFNTELKNCTGKLRSVSCILKADNSWCRPCSPSELESLSGKAKSKNSICLDGKPRCPV